MENVSLVPMLFQLKISEEVEVVQAPNHVRAAKQCVLCGKTTSEGCGSKRKCKAPCPVDNCELLLSFKCLNCKFAYCEEHFVIGSCMVIVRNLIEKEGVAHSVTQMIVMLKPPVIILALTTLNVMLKRVLISMRMLASAGLIVD